MSVKVFIASATEDLPVAESVQAALRGADVHAEVWNQGTVFRPTSGFLESLEEAARRYDFGVFVIGPWDVTTSRGKRRKVPRDNVLLELGLFIGKLSRSRCFIVEPDGSMVSRPTDLLGVATLTYDPAHLKTAPVAAVGPACLAIKAAIHNTRRSPVEPNVLPSLGIRHIFSIPEANSLRDERMRELFESHERGDLRLLARTGFHFLHGDGRNYRGLVRHLVPRTKPNDTGGEVHILLEDPYSSAAATRLALMPIRSNWQKMPPETWAARLQEFGTTNRGSRRFGNLEIRFTRDPVYCSLFFFPDTVFYDPYHLGRRDKTKLPGNEFLVFEFSRPQERGGLRDYYSLLRDHFETLWQRSISFQQLCREHPDELSHLLDPESAPHQRVKGGRLSKPRPRQMDLLTIKPDNYQYKSLAYHDSWLSVDPIVGCTASCEYCFMQLAGWTAKRPQIILNTDEAVSRLLSHPFFVEQDTVLSFGNQTDPFLKPNISYTEAFLQSLEKHEVRNPVVLCTKHRIPPRTLGLFQRLRYVRPVFCLSYSGLPASIENGVEPQQNRDNFKALSDRGLPIIHAWRPIIHRNGSEASIRRVLELAQKHAQASVYIGLKVTPSLFSVYAGTRDLALPEDRRGHYGDFIPEEVEHRLRSIADSEFPSHPLFLHTSCAVSLVLGEPDYNGTMHHQSVCRSSNCPEWKRAICDRAKSQPRHAEVSSLLSRIRVEGSFTIHEHAVEIDASLDQEQCAFLTHRLRFPIRARIALSRNLWGNLYRLSSTLSEVG